MAIVPPRAVTSADGSQPRPGASIWERSVQPGEVLNGPTVARQMRVGDRQQQRYRRGYRQDAGSRRGVGGGSRPARAGGRPRGPRDHGRRRQGDRGTGDLADDVEADAVVKKALAAFGFVDILVNNAGSYWQRPWLETTPADWNELYNQNVASMVRMVRGLVPGMKERRWGRVIAIASGIGNFPGVPALAAYAATKGANINLAVSLVKELAGTGITSNVVSPGPILTPAFEQWVNAVAEQKGWPKEWAQREALFVKEVTPNPTDRLGRVWDIADLVAFLSSPRAGYVNGANIRVDGGSVSSVN